MITSASEIAIELHNLLKNQNGSEMKKCWVRKLANIEILENKHIVECHMRKPFGVSLLKAVHFQAGPVTVAGIDNVDEAHPIYSPSSLIPRHTSIYPLTSCGSLSDFGDILHNSNHKRATTLCEILYRTAGMLYALCFSTSISFESSYLPLRVILLRWLLCGRK